MSKKISEILSPSTSFSRQSRRQDTIPLSLWFFPPLQVQRSFSKLPMENTGKGTGGDNASYRRERVSRVHARYPVLRLIAEWTSGDNKVFPPIYLPLSNRSSRKISSRPSQSALSRNQVSKALIPNEIYSRSRKQPLLFFLEISIKVSLTRRNRTISNDKPYGVFPMILWFPRNFLLIF